MSSSHRRWIARMLLCTLVLAALAPAVARALAFAQGTLAPWTVVCSAPSGMPDGPADDSRQRLEHCAWCKLHQDLLAPPPAAVTVHSPALAAAVPALFLHAPRPLPAWAAAQARAPPSLAG